jgi:hypothetical protein
MQRKRRDGIMRPGEYWVQVPRSSVVVALSASSVIGVFTHPRSQTR